MATIQGVYVALFGRPADPTGLAYFNSVTKNGADLNGIGDLTTTAEYQTRFAGQSNTQIVTAIYQSLFNRAPETAGLTFFVDALNKGTLNIKNIAIAILDGAQGDDKIIVTNKLTAADNFTKAIDTPVEIGSYQGTAAANAGRAFIAGVTKDTNTIPTTAQADTALANLASSTPGSTGTAGVTINIANAATIVGPNNADPATKSTAGDDTINATAIGNTTSIDASAGTDTLNITLTGANGVGVAGTDAAAAVSGGKPTLTSVEKVFVAFTAGNGAQAGAANTTGNAGANFNLDVSGSTGVKELWNNNSTIGSAGTQGANAGTVGAAGDTVTFSNIALGTAAGVKGDTTVTTVFSYANATGASDSATLALENALGTGNNPAAKAITINAIENLNVSVNGASKVAVTDNTLDKVVVTGTGNLDFATASATVKSVDASALNGSLVLNVQGAANGVTVTGTKFADTISLNNLAGNNAITTDKDVVVYNSNNISTSAVKDTINDFTSGEDKIDVKAFALTAPNAVTNLTAAPGANAAVTTSIAKFVYQDANNTFTDVYVDSNKSGTFDVNDLVIKLAGNVDIKATDFIFA